MCHKVNIIALLTTTYVSYTATVFYTFNIHSNCCTVKATVVHSWQPVYIHSNQYTFTATSVQQLMI